MDDGELDWMEETFPLGDGVADTEAQVFCPYCGAGVEILLDPAGGAVQAYVEDCEVCCRPWQVAVRWDGGGLAHVELRTEEEG